MTEPESRKGKGLLDFAAAGTRLPSKAGTRGPKSDIYLSWGGEIYGPSSREEVLAGIRTSWFEESALYWHDGLDEWKSVYEFPVSAVSDGAGDGSRIKSEALPTAPSAPTATPRAETPAPHPRRARAAKPGSRRPGRRGRAIFFGFALLAVVLTVGILLLMMLL